MRATSVRFCVVALVVACVACANARVGALPDTLVVLVPDHNGKVGAVSVKSSTGAGETVIDTAYASARDSGSAAPVVGTVKPEEVVRLFGPATDALPQPPVAFTLYFLEGRDEYTEESRRAIAHVLSELMKRPSAEIEIIGHTDRVGTKDFNDRLSLRRAERVRFDFLQRGVSQRAISIAGRGEREPVVITSDQVPEPRNRRVEINVR